MTGIRAPWIMRQVALSCTRCGATSLWPDPSVEEIRSFELRHGVCQAFEPTPPRVPPLSPVELLTDTADLPRDDPIE